MKVPAFSLYSFKSKNDPPKDGRKNIFPHEDILYQFFVIVFRTWH